ncbi:MAG: ATPase, T2SS/T4P/T4SS family [Candidatus Micrarchaeota archaeon]
MLGWRILSQGEHKLDIPELSVGEKELILSVQERIKEIARVSSAETEEECRKIISDAVKYCASQNGFYLNNTQIEYLCKIAFMHIYGFGFLEPLINDNEIEEISIVGPNKPAYVYIRKTGWKKVNATFETDAAIGELINKMARVLGRHITMQNPRLDAILPNGSRLHASLPPISDGEITIRKFRQRPFSPKELCSNLLTTEVMALLSMIMQCDFSLLVAGNTASGKTTTMNALFSFVPATERIIITEETPEINIPHKHQLRLVANKELGIGLKDLVYDSLRMRPDRMIVGEVRNKEESEALFDVLLAGQARGSYATFHAQSANEALSRLCGFGIRNDDLGSIDCIIVQRRMMEYNSKKRECKEVRKITEIAEFVGGEKQANVFYANGKFEIEKCGLMDKIAENFGLKRDQILDEIKKRKTMISDASVDHLDFFNEIQTKLYGGESSV